MAKKKLLLHVCCAPCAVYVFSVLEKEYDVTGFFYNPNIQPFKEFDFRKKELEKVAKIRNWNIIYLDHRMPEWFQRIKGFEKEPEKGKRCSLCFHMRLEEAFKYARDNGFDMVTSTLSISPYKVTRQINEEGNRLAETFGVEFLPENFKKQDGYRKGRAMAKELGINQQNYCGCTYSKVEQILKVREREKEREQERER